MPDEPRVGAQHAGAERAGVAQPRAAPSRARRAWRVIRTAWITVGIGATVIFVAWSLIAYRATPEAHAALRTDEAVVVARRDGEWRFQPRQAAASPDVGLIFFPGALVDPVAYAPLVREVARAGHVAVILELPRRGAFGGADDPDLAWRARALTRQAGTPRRWVLAGHSRGAVVASELAPRFDSLAGLVLIGTSHPRDVDLSALTVPVTKIVGSRDGLASPAEVEANRHLLPDGTTWIRIEGGNHSQFGWYGFQPGDRRASVSAEEQRAHMMEAVLAAMRASAAPDSESSPNAGPRLDTDRTTP